MRRILVSSFAMAALSLVCLAQSAVQTQTSGSASQQAAATANTSGAQVASASQLQAGSTVQAELTKPIDAHKNKVGDEVVAKTTHDVKSDGRVVIPKGSKLIGHVTDVKAHTKDQAVSQVGLAFDRAILKDGTEMPLMLGIRAIGASQANAAAAADDAMMSGDTSAMGSSGARASGGGGGLLGGARSTTGAVVNTAGSTAGAATNTASSLGAGANGSLSAASQGAVGLPGLSLSADTSTSTHASVISSNGSNVHLDSGTQMILQVNQ
jgi:hypothetical protein